MAGLAGIVLCGGRSSRMGRSKALIEWDGESFLSRAVRTMMDVADRALVAAAPDQPLPSLPESVVVVRDPAPFDGPLAAFTAALPHFGAEFEYVFLIGCDTPCVSAAALRFLRDRIGAADAAIPFVGDRWHPLVAIYRTGIRSVAERLVQSGMRRMIDLIETVDVVPIRDDEFRQVDPNLQSLRNVNTPDEHAALLRGGR